MIKISWYNTVPWPQLPPPSHNWHKVKVWYGISTADFNQIDTGLGQTKECTTLYWIDINWSVMWVVYCD